MKFFIWEIIQQANTWILFQGTVKVSGLFKGNEALLRWENGTGSINELTGARKDGTEAWGKEGIIVSQMGHLPVTSYSCSAFDNNTAAIVPQTVALPASILPMAGWKDARLVHRTDLLEGSERIIAAAVTI